MEHLVILVMTDTTHIHIAGQWWHQILRQIGLKIEQTICKTIDTHITTCIDRKRYKYTLLPILIENNRKTHYYQYWLKTIEKHITTNIDWKQ